MRVAEVALPAAKTKEFLASVACEPDAKSLHKALSGSKAADEWRKCLSQHFGLEPVEVYGAVVPKVPEDLVTVKVRIAADKCHDFES